MEVKPQNTWDSSLHSHKSLPVNVYSDFIHIHLKPETASLPNCCTVLSVSRFTVFPVE
jgi:hypothetical protein